MVEGERELLRTIRSRSKPGRGVRIGIGDDCAVLTPRAGEEMLVTTDFSIEGRHFHLDTHPPEAIGHKCLARGLSDIASMGGRPVAAFLSLAIPPESTRATHNSRSWMDRFYHGLLELAKKERLTLAGGDLSESPHAVADIIVIGAAPKGRALLRSTAHPGDLIYVTGSLGGAAAELATLRSPDRRAPSNSTEHPHFYPQPLLRRKLATACIDISDGLSVDLLHLCDESGLNAEIDAAALPIHPSASLEDTLNGGDDYELLFTASPRAHMPAKLDGIAIHPIGRMLARRARSRAYRMVLVAASGKKMPLKAGGWQHF